MKAVTFVLACVLWAPAVRGATQAAIRAPGNVVHDDRLSAAKDLYAAAAYEEALSALTRLSEVGGLSSDVALEADEYRAFCLIALGRKTDAESVAQTIIRKAPGFQLPPGEISPRVEAMFTQVRKQLLPGLIRDDYRLAKVAVQQKDFAAAETRLLRLRQMIADAEKLGIADESLADVSVLADGFLDLTRALSAPQPALNARTNVPVSKPTATAVPADDPIHAAPDASLTLEPARASTLIPPVVLREVIPPLPKAVANTVVLKRGVLEVTVATDGRVAEAIMRESINPAYDQLIVSATKEWRYKPAVKDGVPVRYVKTITLEMPGRK